MSKSKKFKAIVDDYGLDLDDDWNKIYISSEYHYSNHPDAYHEFVLQGMLRAKKDAGKDVEKFKKLYNEYVLKPLLEDPDVLNRWGWKFLRFFSNNF